MRAGAARAKVGDGPDKDQGAGGGLTGGGNVELSATPEAVWKLLLDPDTLASVVPGCESLERQGEDKFIAQVTIGVAGIKGKYDAEIELRDMVENTNVRLVGKAFGALGFGNGEGLVSLKPLDDGRTILSYSYQANVGGKVAAVGQRMLGTVTRLLIGQFFRGFERRLKSDGDQIGFLSRLFGRRR